MNDTVVFPGLLRPRTSSTALLTSGVYLGAGGPADPMTPVPAESFDAHLRRFGPRPVVGAELLVRVERAGLLGHGGAFVPVALKWRSALRHRGPLTIVANGAESEPVAGKDGTLLRQRPHLVLDGLLIAAHVVGAHRVVLWLHGDDRGARTAVLTALAERGGADGGVPVEVIDGPVHYLAGEGSAIAHQLAGGPALPTVRRRTGEGRTPMTLVHNVETLARVALLARGLAEPQTRLLSVQGEHRVVLEVDRRTTMAEVLSSLSGSVEPHAVLLGGYGGLWAPWRRVAHLPVDEAALRTEGLTLGAGVMVPIPQEICGVRLTAELLAYLASMSARQCGPCLFGLPALAEHWSVLAAGHATSGRVDAMLADAGSVEGRGACHHPDGATRLVASAVATFADDLADHAAGRPCGRSEHLALSGVGR